MSRGREKLGLSYQGPAAIPFVGLPHQFVLTNSGFGILIQFYFQNVGKGFSTATGIYSMGQCSENINIFSASSIKPGLSDVEAEGTVTCISSGTIFTFLACLSTSHRGDKLRLVKSPSGHSAVSPVRCCACCFVSFLCQSRIKDCESTSSSTPPSRPLHAL